MSSQKFSIDDALRFGWDTMRGNFFPLIGFLLLALLIMLVPTLLTSFCLSALGINEGWQGKIINPSVNCIVSVIAAMGLTRIALIYCDQQKPKIGEFFSVSSLFLHYIATVVLYRGIMLAGCLLLIVPGIVWAIQFQFAEYLVVDKGLTPMDALRKSSEITRGAKWNILGFNILVTLIDLLGLLCLVVGLLPAGLITWLAMVFVYRQLLTSTQTTTESTT
ncbi:MAG: hypothetical protein HY711_08160, partial [Candidatus Melainabacteria bacterium]|nr:hypothetical protein [Candidatus Melainabacteria bacterium]